MSNHTVTKTQLINEPMKLKPHVVIVGAGASVAAFPNGDKNGKLLPTMDNFVDITGLFEVFNKYDFSPKHKNFESVYSDLYQSDPNSNLIKDIENYVSNYFSSLELPEHITLYDHLLLSLREKDVVATFNWDPFLFDAWVRCEKYASIPQPVFLHGNVRIGYCEDDGYVGNILELCPECNSRLLPIKLLYPIKEKDYNSDMFIKSEWDYLQKMIKNAFTLSIFGYGAPDTDIEAINLMKTAWKAQSQREFEMVEFIDLKEKEELINQWQEFLFSHHYRCYKDFYKSRIPNSSRRTCESIYHPTIMGKFCEWYPLPKDYNFDQFIVWLKPFIEMEKLKM